MANQAISVKNSKQNLSKAQKAARKKAEAKVVTNGTKPKADKLLNAPERKIFNKLKKYNE